MCTALEGALGVYLAMKSVAGLFLVLLRPQREVDGQLERHYRFVRLHYMTSLTCLKISKGRVDCGHTVMSST